MAFILEIKLVMRLVTLMQIILRVTAIEDYCSKDNYERHGNLMQFTKETTYAEFAVAGDFKGLHCCGTGYRSIQWFKDGTPYPWPLSASQLILYPASANQTVYTNTVTEKDSGNYTCLMMNDTLIYTHTITLDVFEKVPDDPKITYISESQQVALGENVRLFCEAFGGQVDLPDAYNEAVWSMVGHNGTVNNEPRVQQKTSSRENGQTFGTYLIIQDVKPRDFGRYKCTIRKPGKTIELDVVLTEKIEVKYSNRNDVPWTKLALYSSVLLFFCVAASVLYIKFGLILRVRIKDSFSKINESDGKIHDILVLYAPKDVDIVLGVLIPTLQKRYQYTCTSHELSNNVYKWCSELQDSAAKCRRIVAVLSPAALNDNWATSSILEALKQLHGLGPNFSCISLKKLPKRENELKNAQGETLASLVRSMNVILWERSNEASFWYSLRLRLPPKRINHCAVEISSNPENNARLKHQHHPQAQDCRRYLV